MRALGGLLLRLLVLSGRVRADRTRCSRMLECLSATNAWARATGRKKPGMDEDGKPWVGTKEEWKARGGLAIPVLSQQVRPKAKPEAVAPPMSDADQERAFGWCLEKLDGTSDAGARRGVLGWARQRLSGERLAVVEETAELLENPCQSKPLSLPRTSRRGSKGRTMDKRSFKRRSRSGV